MASIHVRLCTIHVRRTIHATLPQFMPKAIHDRRSIHVRRTIHALSAMHHTSSVTPSSSHLLLKEKARKKPFPSGGSSAAGGDEGFTRSQAWYAADGALRRRAFCLCNEVDSYAKRNASHLIRHSFVVTPSPQRRRHMPVARRSERPQRGQYAKADARDARRLAVKRIISNVP